MGKTTKISSLFKNRRGGGLLTVPLCYNAKTLSFRRDDDDVTKTVNSVFFHHRNNLQNGGDVLEAETPESWFTNSSESASYSTESDQDLDAESLETVVRGVVRSERLFFEPGVTSSILKKEQDENSNLRSVEEEDRDRPPLEDIGEAVAMESVDPYGDFRRSMEEMLRIHEDLASDWERLESMLGWYLRMNGKRSHGVIVSAFVDLLVNLSGVGNTSETETTTATESNRYLMAVSSLPSSPVYSSGGCNEIRDEGDEEKRSC